MGLEGGMEKKEEEKEKKKEKKEKFPLCKSIGHRSLRGRCPQVPLWSCCLKSYYDVEGVAP